MEYLCMVEFGSHSRFWPFGGASPAKKWDGICRFVNLRTREIFSHQTLLTPVKLRVGFCRLTKVRAAPIGLWQLAHGNTHVYKAIVTSIAERMQSSRVVGFTWHSQPRQTLNQPFGRC